MGVYSSTVATAYADKIKAVYECLGEIRKVADRLTPVADLTSFQAQIQALYDQLDLLVEASNIIVTATPVGEQILTGTVPTIQALLEIGQIPDDVVRMAQLLALLDALRADLEGQIAGATDGMDEINVVLDQLTQFHQEQLVEMNGLQISYQNLATGQQTNQTNIESALSRLTINEGNLELIDQRLDTIDQSIADTVYGLQGTNDIVAGHTASITTLNGNINLHTASIDQLNSDLINVNTGVAAHTSALELMETTITGIGDDIVAQSQQTTALKSAIGGSGNLMPNAAFDSNANGWHITVAEEDWATSVLTVDTFNMPVDVHCLEVLGTPTPLGQIVIESPPVLIEAGNYYILSGYPCVDNGIVSLSYKAFDNAGAVLDQAACPATFNNTTTTNFDAYTRTWVKFLAPAGATKLRAYLTVTGDGDFITQAALFRPMVEKAWAEQVEPSAWTPNITGVPEALATAITGLTTEVSDINGELSAQSSAITSLTTTVAGKASTSALNALDTRVTTAEGTISAHTSSINALNTTVAGKASTTALSALDTRVTTAEGNISANTSAITSLNATVAGKASTTALSALDTRVTTAEGNITANAAATTRLKAVLSTQGITLDGNSTGDWVVTAGAGELATATTSDVSVMAGKLVTFGNNSGNDEVWARFKDFIPYDPSKLYRVRIRARKDSSSTGAPTWYAGLCAMDRDQTNFITTAGTSTTGLAASHYVAQAQSNTAFTEVVGYFKGTAAGARTGSGTITNPWTMPDTVKWIAPMFLGNYNGQTGRCYLDRFVIEDADALGAADTNATALTTLDTRVTSAEGNITAQASSISTLTASLNNNTASITQLSRVTASANDNGGQGILDPGFERTDGWGSAGNTVDSPDTVLPADTVYMPGTTADYTHTGVKSLRFNPSTGNKSVFNNSWLRVTPGRKYRVTYWYRTWLAAPPSGSYVRMSVRRWDPSGTYVSYSFAGGQVSFNGSTTAPYTKVSFVHTVAAGDGIHQWAVQAFVNGGTAAILVDDVTVELIDEETAANWSLTLDVSNNVSGLYASNNGTLSSFLVKSDVFGVVNPSGGAAMTWQNGVLWNKGSTYSAIIGQNFGISSDLLMWMGPNPASPAAATKAAALMYFTNAGVLYVKGTLIAGTIQNGGYSSTLATAVTYSTGAFGTTGNPIVVNASYAFSQTVSGSTLSTTFSAGSGSTQATLELWRKVGTGAFTLVGSTTVTGTQTITNQAPDATSFVTYNMAGSITFTDNAGGTTDRTYETRMSGRTLKGYTVSGGGSAIISDQSQATGCTTSED